MSRIYRDYSKNAHIEDCIFVINSKTISEDSLQDFIKVLLKMHISKLTSIKFVDENDNNYDLCGFTKKYMNDDQRSQIVNYINQQIAILCGL